MAKDLFSGQASTYAQYRPSYPKELFEYIASLVNERGTAWDCATGNGQAAISLADYFTFIEATDISDAQLVNAVPHPRIHYSKGSAEQTAFASSRFDLVTVAQAYHWLDWEAFRKEAIRVGKNGGLIAIWMYNRFTTGHAEIDALFEHFYRDITGPYWDVERKYVDANYKTVAFDFEDVQTKTFTTSLLWNREQAKGYLSSWSAVQKYMAQEGTSPLLMIQNELNALWREDEIYTVTFSIYLKHGRIAK